MRPFTYALGCLILLQPVAARQIQAIAQTTPLTPSRYFLLKADGQDFKDTTGKIAGALTIGSYTTKFSIAMLIRKNAETKTSRPALEAILSPVDTGHHLSLDRPVASLEIDSQPLPIITAFDSFNYRQNNTEHLDITLTKVGIKRILAAKEQVVLKFRLHSKVLAKSGECTRAVLGSSKQLSCANPYTGAVFSGSELKTLQTLLQPLLGSA